MTATIRARLDRHFDPTDANAGADAAYAALKLMKAVVKTLPALPAAQANAVKKELRATAGALCIFGYDDSKETFNQFLERLAQE